jgi:hypothetical protein
MVGIPNGSNQKEFNLVTTKYNILLATGFVSQYILSYHGIYRQPSGKAVDFKVNVPFIGVESALTTKVLVASSFAQYVK